MRGTKERFAKYAPLLPQSQGITSPAVEIARQMAADSRCPTCKRYVLEHTPREIHDCAFAARSQP